MKAGTIGLFSKAATATRVLCPTQASRPICIRDGGPSSQPKRELCSSSSSRPQRPRAIRSTSMRPDLSSKRNFHASSNLQATKDPYSVLGVNKGASAGDIKKAYYGLAKKYHPDTNKDPTAKDRFAEAQSAYELLTDPQKKAAWDQFGAAAFDQGGPTPGGGDPFGGAGFGSGAAGAGGFSGGFGGGYAADFNFEDLFKGFGGFPGVRRGRSGGRNPFQQEEILVGDTIEVQTNISFKEAATGTTKTINISPLTTCKTCSGGGLKAGAKRSECKACGGTGTRVHFMSGGFQMASTCGVCGGQGITIPKGSECRTCSGNGVVRERKAVTVDIPGGIDDGMAILVREEGDAPPTGQAANPNSKTMRGDLRVLIRVATDPKFSRSGSDILYTATIPLTTALLGGQVKIPTLDGEVEVKVATGTGTGDKITLGGMGMKSLERGKWSGKGDLKVEFKVSMPKYLSANQRTILEMLADEMGDKTAKRIMNVGRPNNASESGSPSADDHKNEGFLKSVWHNITGNAAHKDAADEHPSSSSPSKDEPATKDSATKDKDKKASGSGA
ncbi:DnaJ-domain-containing protein [Mollisia scopiformis]|uniref:DnaJ homolog 1, mitochondrial n=1 Tax=Mollisia scopiformis TaxID=149040 RepID=A0A132BEL8_MOLSC|nr:DnaJ-domain-containing protein [Mollisia scopiformis]KUJ10294.1 DnaJ-domain-containing protein [Mollisia scopiformis]